jgi:hypothetical protein
VPANGTCVTIYNAGTPVTSKIPTNLMVMDADNLNVGSGFQIPERLAGKSVFNADETV